MMVEGFMEEILLSDLNSAGEMQMGTEGWLWALTYGRGPVYFQFQHGKGGWSKPMKIDCSSNTTTREVTEA